MDGTKKRKADENGSTETAVSSLTNEDAEKLLAPLTVDQLRQILQTALQIHPDILNSVRQITDQNTTLRKLFVRGLSADTTTDTLKTLFSAYGPLDEAVVITDKATLKSKGYGFVTFKHVDGAIRALNEPSKKIDGRITVTQLANVGSGGVGDVAMRKVYVGSVPFEVSSERLLEFFGRFGEIEEGPLGFDKGSGKVRGFAFFVYKTEEGARAAVAEPMKSVDGHQVMCKFAIDNKKVKPGMQSGTGGPPQFGGHPTGMGYGHNSVMPPVVGGPVMPVNAVGYGGSQYGGVGPSFGEYGGMSNPGSFMHRRPPGSMGMQSGGYPDFGHGGLASSGLPSQPQQPPRMPPGGMYQGPPPYY